MKARIRTKHKEKPPFEATFTIMRGEEVEGSDYVRSPLAHRSYAVISDIVGNIQGDFNPCRHVKGIFPDYREEYLHDSGIPTGQYSLSEGSFRPDDPVSHILSWESAGFLDFMDGFDSRASYEFTSAIQEEVSLPNFLIELFAPIKKGLKSLEVGATSFKDLCEKLALNYRKKRHEEFLREQRDPYYRMRNNPYQDMSAHWIAWNYAIRPFLGDLKKMIRALGKITKRLEWLLENNHKTFKTRYRNRRKFDFQVVCPLAPLEILDSPLGGDPKDLPFEFVFEGEVSVRATSWCHARFDIPDNLLVGMPGLAWAWATYHGILNPIGVAWEATKFSWLVDWFRSASSKLEQKKINLSPYPPANVSAVGTTLFRYFIGEVYIREKANHTNQFPCGTFTLRDYDRRPGTYSSRSEAINPDNLGFWHASILAALIHQRVRPGRQRKR